jgi:hypothetical protein
MTDIYRQGDVLLLRVDSIPAEAKPRKGKGRLILAYGEATGHHHSLVATLDGKVETLETDAGEVFARIMAAPALETHQEHATITIPPGAYKVIRQVEYAPRELPRQVLD